MEPWTVLPRTLCLASCIMLSPWARADDHGMPAAAVHAASAQLDVAPTSSPVDAAAVGTGSDGMDVNDTPPADRTTDAANTDGLDTTSAAAMQAATARIEDEGLQVAMGDAGWWATAPHEMLADMRGAYDVAPGLRVGFGIDRAVYANGSLLSHTSGQFGVVLGVPGAPDLPALLLVQQGAGNAVQWSGLAAGGLGTLVQNSLNDRQFAVVTTIDATVNSMQLLKGLQLDRALQDALTLPLAGTR